MRAIMIETIDEVVAPVLEQACGTEHRSQRGARQGGVQALLVANHALDWRLWLATRDWDRNGYGIRVAEITCAADLTAPGNLCFDRIVDDVIGFAKSTKEFAAMASDIAGG